MKQIAFLLCVLGMCACLTSCFRGWRKTDKEIRHHYANKSVKPTYYTIENDSLKLFIATIGADTLPPLVLIHGAPGAWYGYLNMMDDSVLQQKHHIIAIDRLSYNHSKHKKRRFVTSIETHAKAALLALSLNHSNHKGVLLGRSFGAPIAAKMAMINPGQFAKLIMLAPAIDPSKEKFWWFSKPAKWWIVRVWLPRRLNVATFEKFAHVRELEKLKNEWSTLRVPTTVVQGSKDWIVDPSNLDYARERIANAQFILLPDAGHLISYSHPLLVRELVMSSSKTGDGEVLGGSSH